MKKAGRGIKKTIKQRINIKLDSAAPKKNVVMNDRVKRRIENKPKMSPLTVKLLTRDEIRRGKMALDSGMYPLDEYRVLLNKEIPPVENLRVLFLISNYERERMFRKLLKSIKDFNTENVKVDYFVVDDVSSYKLRDKNFQVNAEHRGKLDYWRTFNDLFDYTKYHLYDIYVFTPNDFQNYDFNRIIEYGMKLKDINYVFNIINDGREMSWNSFKPANITDDVRLQFFTDCGFFTNQKTLASLNFKVNEIKHNVGKASGSMVGCQLTDRLNMMRTPMFTPIKSIAFHGHHDSLMHPEERKLNRLISE